MAFWMFKLVESWDFGTVWEEQADHGTPKVDQARPITLFTCFKTWFILLLAEEVWGDER